MKLKSVIRWMVLAAVVLVAAHAFAQPVNLVCTGNYGVVRITFDEDRGTAFSGDDPASRASFTATNIKWAGFYDKNSPAAFNLDRISGILDESFICHTCSNPNIRLTATRTCVVAEKKF
jgi:hypothetical protein